MKKLLLVLLLLLTPATVFADPAIDVSHLNYDEKMKFQECHKDFFWDNACHEILNKACEAEPNKTLWDCIDQGFAECRKSDFRAAGCEEKLQYVCDRTKDGYDSFCDRYRYEVCLKDLFQGEECQAVRRNYTLPILKDTIGAFRRQVSESLPELSKWYCEISGGDKTHPLNGHCENPGILPTDFETFEKVYRMSRQMPEERRDETRSQIYQALLMGTGPSNLFEKIAASNYWILESERTAHPKFDAQLKEFSSEVLARFGDDSLISTFLLVEAAHHSNAKVRENAIRGLGFRTYPSDLGMMVVLRSLSAESKSERIAGIEAIGKRWLNAAASIPFGRLTQGQLGSLMDCHQFPADPAFLSDLNDVDAIGKYDFSDPKYLCNTGMAGRLQRLNQQVLDNLKRKANDGSLDHNERAAAIASLAQLAVISPAAVEQTKEFLKGMLENSSNAALADDLIVGISTNFKSNTAETYAYIFGLVKAALERNFELKGSAPRANISRLLVEATRHNMIHPIFDDISVESQNLTPVLIDSCVKNSELHFTIAMDCFVALHEKDASMRVLSFAEELASRHSRGGSFETRNFAIELYAIGVFNGPKLLSDGDAEAACEIRARALDSLGDLAKNIVASEIKSTPLLPNLSDALSMLMAKEDETPCSQMENAQKGLVSGFADKLFLDKLTQVFLRALPKLPLDEWYKAFSKKNPVDVVQPFVPPAVPSGVTIFRVYQTREDLRKAIEAALQGLNREDALFVQFGWEDIQKMYAVGLTGKLSVMAKAPEIVEKEFWKY